MKIASKLAIAAFAATGIGAAAPGVSGEVLASPRPDAWQREVTVCTGGASSKEVVPAKGSAASIFRPIGIVVHWQGLKKCPAGAIQIRFSGDTRPGSFPGALAYALPYEGTQVVVFLDRIQKSIEDSFTSALLAHVMVHEITHILQGVSRHSDSGMMKARWEAAEHLTMSWRPLPFTPDDVAMIRHGFERKDVLLSASGKTGNGHR